LEATFRFAGHVSTGNFRRKMSDSTYTIEEIAGIISGKLFLNAPAENKIRELLTDSRKVNHPSVSLYFAIKGERHDGNRFVIELFDQGVRNFIVTELLSEFQMLKANFILVDDPLLSMQTLTASHRKKFSIPVIGITGSNGKTIVKEWIYQLLRADLNIVRSPKSYNSQVGVPLSVWQMQKENQLAVFEAGISLPGEMKKLEETIHPTIGIFTNIGSAHDENFDDPEQKILEKLQLFTDVETLIYCKDYQNLEKEINGFKFSSEKIKLFAWSRKSKADLQVGRITRNAEETEIQAVYENNFINIKIPFSDEASIENAILCWSLMLTLGYSNDIIRERMQFLSPVAMRLEMKNGINNCSVINDSYNSDIGSLTIALDFLNQQKQHDKRTVILSDILQSGKNEENLYNEVAGLLKAKGIDQLIGIGPAISRQKEVFNLQKKFYATTEDFLRDFSTADFRDETILLKGARPFGFETISKTLQQKTHETVLEINLNALVHNLNYYRSRLKPETKIMAMVKATSYGSGSFEIANVLQFHHVDYLAVAFTDEGIELRKAGITLPIMIMNPELMSFELMIKYRLEPEIYNFRLLNQLQEILKKYEGDPFKIHIKLDTGMHRLGFAEEEMNELVVRLNNNKKIKVQSVFSHLSSSDEAEHDGFTKMQISRMKSMSEEITGNLTYPVMRHILNSSGILRFNEAQFEMVRLGIGLYGFSSTAYEQQQLQQVATLKTTISQIRNVPAKETIGYNRKGKLKRDSVIATIAIGYADGISRRLGNGNGSMLVNGKLAPIIGNVCMDMCMLDITEVQAREGDEVIVFGSEYPVSIMADAIGTIPYEVLVNVSQRVKRVYFQE
jgi:alanine racemase